MVGQRGETLASIAKYYAVDISMVSRLRAQDAPGSESLGPGESKEGRVVEEQQLTVISSSSP